MKFIYIMSLNVEILEMIVLHISMQGQGILEHTNTKT